MPRVRQRACTLYLFASIGPTGHTNNSSRMKLLLQAPSQPQARYRHLRPMMMAKAAAVVGAFMKSCSDKESFGIHRLSKQIQFISLLCSFFDQWLAALGRYFSLTFILAFIDMYLLKLCWLWRSSSWHCR